MMLDRVLMLSCHRDDDVLSCGGTLLQCKKLLIHYFNRVHPNIKQEYYDAEAEAVKRYLGCETSYSNFMCVNRLEMFNTSDFVGEIETIINEYEPETIIGPFPSYNGDHRVIYNAMLTAVRVHDENFYVKNVLLAEQPETHTPAYQQFIPQLFVPIDINKKIELYELYASQVRAHRSVNHIKAMAKVRGMQCDKPYAEAFEIVRMGF